MLIKLTVKVKRKTSGTIKRQPQNGESGFEADKKNQTD